MRGAPGARAGCAILRGMSAVLAPSPALLEGLLGRHSLGAKHLGEPGPDDAALRRMAEAALHAPDHAALAPYRFKVVRGAARTRLAELFVRSARAGGKDEAAAALDAERALRPPVTVAVVARPSAHPEVPETEQWVALGGALANFLNAAHALGYAGKMLSGRKARDPALQAAFCDPGEQLVGWIALGTPLRAPAAGPARAAVDEVLVPWP